MKKILNRQNMPVVFASVVILGLIVLIWVLIWYHSVSEANLNKQQQWTSNKNQFDKAFEIAASDKDTPDKTLYIPKLINFIGHNIDEAIANIGQGATIVSSNQNQTIISLTNESGNEISGTPTVIIDTYKNKKIKKMSFKCNTWLLGYGSYGFIDFIDNEHIIEKSISEAGLELNIGVVKCPTDRNLYTMYDSDGTTVILENFDFNGQKLQNGRMFKWSANLNFDYKVANEKGNLAETIRTITISIE